MFHPRPISSERDTYRQKEKESKRYGDGEREIEIEREKEIEIGKKKERERMKDDVLFTHPLFNDERRQLRVWLEFNSSAHAERRRQEIGMIKKKKIKIKNK